MPQGFSNIYYHIHFQQAAQNDDSTVPTHLTISFIRHVVINPQATNVIYIYIYMTLVA